MLHFPSRIIYSTGGDGSGLSGLGADIQKEVIIYFPNPGFMGSDSCVYEACAIDQESGEMDMTKCVQATIFINVSDCPVDETSSNVPTMVPPEVVSKQLAVSWFVLSKYFLTRYPPYLFLFLPPLENEGRQTHPDGTCLVRNSCLLIIF